MAVEVKQGYKFLPALEGKGLWITYVLYDKTAVTEWYSAEAIDDTTFGDSANWRDGSNALVGDISISSDGYWVINGDYTSGEIDSTTAYAEIIVPENGTIRFS
nr:MAG TPA: hypothetical protein [Crassvirales sp.]